MEREASGYYGRFQITLPLLEMRNLARVAQLMVECATGREESRGLHYNSDYPETGATGRDSILIPPHFDGETALTGPTDQLPPYGS